ncbi:RNA polymerase sigma factor [Oceanobacillus sp. CAU 1775]
MDEREIINLVKQENKAAFENLVITYKPSVEKFSYQFGIDSESIPEVVQETFNKVYQNIDQFQEGKFSTWLYKITLNVNRNFYRKKQKENKSMKRSSTAKERNYSGAYYFETDENFILHLAIQELEEKYRLPLILYFFHDQRFEEIASILKSNLSSVKLKIDSGLEKLKGIFERIEKEEGSLNGRQTESLDVLLIELKENYKLLPGYVSVNKIMSELPLKKQKKRRWNFIPVIGIVIGFFIIFVIALPEAEKSEQASLPVSDEEEEPLDEIEEYANDKKEEFRKELGVQSLEGFYEVDYVQQLIWDRESHYFTDDELIEMIDEIFVTPEQLMKELEQTKGEERYQKWMMLLQKYTNLAWSFSENLQRILNDSSISLSEQAELLENQYNYNGPLEIVEFLNMLHRHGYKLEKNGDFLEVGNNYMYLVDNIEHVEDDEGIIRFLTFISEKMYVHQYVYIHDSNDIPWQEYDDILLEMEDIYRSYPEYRELFSYYTGAIHATSNYLNEYIHGGFRSRNNDVKEEVIEELRHFTENHEDSIFWQVINNALKKYETEASEEPEVYRSMMLHNAQFFFNNIESELGYDEIHELYNWPFIRSTQVTYRNIEKENNGTEEILAEMSPVELLSLYTYSQASVEDPALYESLYFGEEEQESIDWFSIFEQAELLLENVIDEDTVEFSFVNTYYGDFENTIIATATLHHDGESWKVISQEMIDMY